MTTYTQGAKSISVTFGEIVMEKNIKAKDVVYTVTAPKIVCDNEEDATYIKNEVNTFINTLVKNIIK